MSKESEPKGATQPVSPPGLRVAAAPEELHTVRADYLYFMKNESHKLNTFIDSLFSFFKMPKATLDFSSPFSSLSEYMTLGKTKIDDSIQMVCSLRLLDDVYTLVIQWNGHSLPDITPLAEARLGSKSADSQYFGHTTVTLSDGEASKDILGHDMHLKEDQGSLMFLDPISGSRFHGYAILRYVSEASPADPTLLLLQRDLPKLDMAIRRLLEKLTIFEDRREAISAERRALDKTVAQFFHREVLSYQQAEQKQVESLSKEIGRLSSIYATLASDAQLVMEAIAEISAERDSIQAMIQRIAGSSKGKDSNLAHHLDNLADSGATSLRDESDSLNLLLQRIEAAIGIVRTEVGLLRGAETMEVQSQTRELIKVNVELQRERMALLVAAQVIEFVIIFYYSLSSWQSLVGPDLITSIPALIQLPAVALFAAAGVALTHYIARSLRDSIAHYRGLILSAVGLLTSVVLMVLATVFFA